MNIAIGIPAFNEEKSIASIILQLKKKYQTIIVCDDGSSDMTGDIADKLGVILITHKKNLGYGAAIRSIFLKARELEIEALVTFDADGQHRVEDIESMLKPIEKNKTDIVIGSRFMEDNSNVPKYRKAGIKTITGLTNVATGLKISDSQSGFRSYNKKTLDNINPSDFGMGISTEILIKAKKMNLKIMEIPIVILYEGDTSTHHPVSHGTSVILSTMKYVSIERPLSFYGIPGFVLFSIGIFFSVWTLQIFSESRQIITNIALIGMGGLVLGGLCIMTAIILYSTVSVVREKN
ncbi:glycosyltransferase family 2 protein [Nitrosopumilus sp.]|uniref:glycosyltransferase family 2 protein n=1 Tax=Nitrosopumilus sp. TaxID=2024843 RepID=UPI003D0E4006